MKKDIIPGIRLLQMVAEGRLMARHEGRVLFVEGGAPGDIADVQIVKKKKGYLVGKILKLHYPSPDRGAPFCGHFGICGGCKWQHIQYEKQLVYKEYIVEESFRRTGKIHDVPLKPILPSIRQTHYRNKLEFTFTNNRWLTKAEIESGTQIENRNGLGFHIPGAFDRVIEINQCWLQDEMSNEIRNGVASFARKNNISFFDLRKQTGLLRNLIIRNTTLGEWMVVVCFAKHDKEKTEKVMQYLKQSFPVITSLYFVVNEKRNDTIFDLDPVCYYGQPVIREKIGDLVFRIGPKSFFQTNSLQASLLYGLIETMADIKEGNIVYDLYSGTGSIALTLARNAEKVIGIEQVEAAVADAEINAVENNISNAYFVSGATEKMLSEDFLKEHGKPDVIVTDPPRAGMHPSVVERLNQSGAGKMVYVSCNPVTMARDIQLMLSYYRLEALQPVDMFPHTYQIECVALLIRK